MTRMLLTLLALLTGLAAQLSPAQAAVRTGGETEIGAVERAPQLARTVARVVARPVGSPPAIALAKSAQTTVSGTYITLPVRTVLTRIDRARE